MSTPDPFEYCRSKAAPEGSDAYYAVLFVPRAARDAVIALLALQEELCEAVEACSDIAVARHKLEFWGGELLTATPRHPVAVAIARSGGESLVGSTDRAGLVTAALARATTAQVHDAGQLRQECLDGAGRTLALACIAAGANPPGDAARVLGAAIEQARLLRLPRRAGAPPHAGVPLRLLGEYGVRPQEVDRGETGDAVRALRAALLLAARQGLEQALAPGDAPPPLARALGELALARVQALARGGFVEAATGAGITPLRKLWIAWRYGR